MEQTKVSPPKGMTDEQYNEWWHEHTPKNYLGATVWYEGRKVRVEIKENK